MTQAVAPAKTAVTLTGLLAPLSDRTLLLPNVALAELVPLRGIQTSENMPRWLLGQVGWRDLRLPLLSFEAASGAEVPPIEGARVAVLNALGGREKFKFMALLLQGIPRSVKVSEDLPAADVSLAVLELGAARIGDDVVRIPDLIGLEQLLADAGLI